MKAKEYLVIVGFALIGAVCRGAGTDATGKEETGGKPVEVREQGETLAGLEGVLVSTGFGLPDVIKCAGVSEKEFRAEMKTLLSKHGIKTYSFEEYEESNRMPVLVLQVSAVECKEQAGHYAVFMKLGLWQRVMLLTEPMRSDSAMTWQAASEGVMSKDFLYQDVKGMWEQLAAKFINDFPGAIPMAAAVKGKSEIDELERGVLYWVMCTNPDCGHKWQMDRKDYFIYLREHQDPMVFAPPGIVCPKCGEASGYRGVKCEKCGAMFLRGTVAHDYADRCPECGHSETEALRKEARSRDEQMAPKAEERNNK
jgi:hypothetical protein